MQKRTSSISRGFISRSFARSAVPTTLWIGGLIAFQSIFDGRDDVYVAKDDADCTRNTSLSAEQCELAYRRALRNAQQTGPKFRSQADCEAEFPDGQCSATTVSNDYGTSGGGYYGGTSSYWSSSRTQTTPGYRAMTPSQPQMAGFMVNPSSNSPTQPFNPVFSHRDSRGRTSLVTAAGEKLRSGKNGLNRVSSHALTRPQSGTRATLNRGGFGRVMVARASAGG